MQHVKCTIIKAIISTKIPLNSRLGLFVKIIGYEYRTRFK